MNNTSLGFKKEVSDPMDKLCLPDPISSVYSDSPTMHMLTHDPPTRELRIRGIDSRIPCMHLFKVPVHWLSFASYTHSTSE